MGSTPLYIQIYKSILASIKNGTYKENTALPSERELCEKYFVSRSTIRQTISLLKDSDLVYAVHGKGNFIKPQVFVQPLTKVYSFKRNDSNGIEYNFIMKELEEKEYIDIFVTLAGIVMLLRSL